MTVTGTGTGTVTGPCVIQRLRYPDGRPLLFEGAQGALLDPDHGFVPNVTFTNTA